ncbi:glycosyltransferase [Glaciecola siphonariae]|uniref:Glycosyltransferase n=1 Tax=Glaciecola siphonariae TaxID=521012 RepID=A0ABV9LYH0_9ALTE
MHLFFFPDYTSTNPYQRLLYCECAENNLTTSYADITSAIAFLREHAGEQAIFHLHWQNVITGVAQSAHEHRILAKAFLSELAIFKGLGGKVVWTIHNKLPHDVKFKRAELEFHQSLSNAVDVILLHDENTFALINQTYAIAPSKVRYIKHGHYIDVYANELSQSEAREKLSIPNDHFVYSFIGQLRPYKGLDDFVDASYGLTHQERVSGLIAGKPVWPYHIGKVNQMCSALPHLHVFETYIADIDLQLYLNASDVLVFPYKEVLTSGSIILSLSFGRPVVIPKVDSFRAWFDLPFVFTYEQEGVHGLEHVLKEVSKVSRPELALLGEQAFEFAKTLDWQESSQQLVALAKTILAQKHNEYIAEYENKRVNLSCNNTVEQPSDDDIAVCVVNFYSHAQVRALSRSISMATKKSVKLFVLDNSVDEQEYIALCSNPYIDYSFKSASNLGYASGNNALISIAKAKGFKIFSILNPDIEIRDDVFSALTQNIVEQANAIYSPLILRNNQSISFFKASIRSNDGKLEIEHELDGAPKDFAPKGMFESDTLNGCALFFHADIIERYGYIPEDYFLYFEETDWTSSAKQQGAQLLVNSRVSLLHLKESQAGGVPSLSYVYYLLRNALHFARKHNYDIGKTEAKYKSSFVKPWVEVLNKRAPRLVACFKAVCQLAFEHGYDGVKGEQDFLSQIHRLSDYKGKPDGYIEARSKKGLVGWAVSDAGVNAAPAEILVLINQRFVKSFTCDKRRDDMNQLGYNVQAGFDIDIQHAFNANNVELINAVSLKKLGKLGGFLQTPSKPYQYTIKKRFQLNQVKGFIDGYSDGKLVGWACDSEHPDIPVELELFINDSSAAIAIASHFRPELARQKGINENCGFVFHIDPAMMKKKASECVIRVRGRPGILLSRSFELRKNTKNFDTKIELQSFFKWSYVNGMTPYGVFERSKTLKAQIKAQKLSLIEQAAYLCDANNSNYPLVSVIMPAFNRQSEIKMAITSLFNQSYTRYELIVIDDGSTDETANVVEEICRNNAQAQTINLIKQPVNLGVSAARNAGLKASKGDIIAYLDTDNEWDADYLAIAVDHYLKHPEAESAYAGQEVWYVDPYNQQEFRTNIRLLPFNRSSLENGNFIDLNVFSHTRSALEKYGIFREDMRRLVDWELILRYTEQRPPVFIPALLNKYYVGLADNQITTVEPYESNILKLLEAVK